MFVEGIEEQAEISEESAPQTEDQNLEQNATLENEDLEQQQDEDSDGEGGEQDNQNDELEPDNASKLNLETKDTFIPDAQLTEQVQKRINKLTYEKHQIERDLNAQIKALTDENNQLKQGSQQSNAGTANEAPKELADFNWDHDKYEDYLIDHKANEIVKQKMSAMQKNTTDNEINQKVSKYTENLKRYSKNNTGFTELAVQMEHAIPNDTPMQEFILSSDKGVEIHHHLLKNYSELVRIQGLSPMKQGAELAKIEAMVVHVKHKKPSQAPAPATKRPAGGARKTGSTGRNVFPM